MLQLFVDVCSGFATKLCAGAKAPGLLFLTLVKAVAVGVGVFFPLVEVRGLARLVDEVTYWADLVGMRLGLVNRPDDEFRFGSKAEAVGALR